MICAVYRSERKADTYVYVIRQDDPERNLDAVPGDVGKALGQLTHVMDIDLSTRQQLARVDTAELRKALEEKGLYIQMPPGQAELLQLEERLSKL